MSGYGFRDSSVIVQAIGDYAKYTENKRRYEQDRDDQQKRLSIADARYEDEKSYTRNNYANETEYNHARQKVEDDRMGVLRGREDKEYERLQGLQSEYDGALEEVTTEFENNGGSNIGAIDISTSPGSQVVARGFSGKGTGLGTKSNGDGTSTIMQTRADGSAVPMNLIPELDDSPPIRFRDGEMDINFDHFRSIVDDPNIPDEQKAIAARSGFVSDKDGVSRIASEEEFKQRLKENGSLLKPSIPPEQAAPPVPSIGSDIKSVVTGSGAAFGASGGFAAKEQILSNNTSATKVALEATQLLGDVGGVIASYFSDPKEAKEVSKTVDVDKEGRIEPKADASPKDIEKTHKALVDKGVDPRTVMPSEIVAKISEFTSLPAGIGQSQYIAQEYGSTPALRRFAKAKLQMDGNFDEYRNIIDTGYPKTSLRDISSDRNEARKIALASREYNRKVTEMTYKYRQEMKEDQVKAAANLKEEEQKLQDDWFENNIGAYVAGVAKNYNSKSNFGIPYGQMKEAAAGVAKQSLDNLLVMYPEMKQLIGSPAFDAAMQQASMDFGEDFGYGNSDGGSIYPYFAKKLVPHEAYDPKRINQISSKHNIPADKVTNEVVSAYRQMILDKQEQGLDPNLSEAEVRGIMATVEQRAEAAKKSKE